MPPKQWRSERRKGDKRFLRNFRRGLHHQTNKAASELEEAWDALEQLRNTQPHPPSVVQAATARFSERRERYNWVITKWKELDGVDGRLCLDNGEVHTLSVEERLWNIEMQKEEHDKGVKQWFQLEKPREPPEVRTLLEPEPDLEVPTARESQAATASESAKEGASPTPGKQARPARRPPQDHQAAPAAPQTPVLRRRASRSRRPPQDRQTAPAAPEWKAESEQEQCSVPDWSPMGEATWSPDAEATNPGKQSVPPPHPRKI